MSRFETTNKMESEENDFVVETKGHCFLCLKRKRSLQRLAASELDIDPSASPLNCLQCLSRYIELDMRKVFCSDDLESIPPHLLEKVQKSNLKAELCEECASINERFSELYRQREKIDMEMASCLQVILSTLGTTKESGVTVKLKNMTELQTIALDKGKLEVVAALRKDVIEKGASKIGRSASSPRIKIKRLTRKEATASSKPKRKASPRKSNMDMDEQGCQPSNVKSEDVNEDDFVMDDDNGSLIQHEDCNRNSDEEYGKPENVEKRGHLSNDPSSKKEPGSEDVTPTANTTHTISVTLPSSTSRRRVTSELAWTTSQTTGKRKCKICSKEFMSKPGFYNHYKSVHLQAKYKCNLCGKEFTSHNGFKSHHQAVHMGVRFKCLGCAKCFSDRSNWRKHQQMCSSGN